MEHITAVINDTKTKTRDWFVRFADTPHARAWLAFFSFAESSFFPIPPDVLLIAILSSRARGWISHAFITTIFSVLGGIAGYALGFFFFDLFGRNIIAFFGAEAEMARVEVLFSDNAFWAIFISAFSPIPYKVFTISAGFFKIDLEPFIAASLIGRGLRFFPVAYLAERWGGFVGQFIFKYFNAISLVVVACIIAFLLFSGSVF